MAARLIIDGNAVYEIDEECLECQEKKTGSSSEPENQKLGELKKTKI